MGETTAARPSHSPSDTVLLGPVSVDRYIGEGRCLPGGGAFNMAIHWSQQRFPHRFVTRCGTDQPELFVDALVRHRIDARIASVVMPGQSASIDIVIGDDRQPHMDHFVEGVWTSFRLDDYETQMIVEARRLHGVMVDPVAHELNRCAAAGQLDHLELSADFLSFRHYDVDRFAATLDYVDLAFIGWPGDRDDPTISAVRDAVFAHQRLAIVTLGSRGVLVLDGRTSSTERFVSVAAVEVTGTTIGCGDAFIAAFLATWWGSGDLDAALLSGKQLGSAATGWRYALPDDSYFPLLDQ
jgi:sugar/nucleoside kinase (ribokinase family)